MQLLADALAVMTSMQGPALMLALGGVGLYVAARLCTHALIGAGSAKAPAGELEPSIAGGMAIGHWAPTVAVSGAAMAAGRADIAVGVAFATSVASLLLALGMTVFLVPSESLPASRRAWPFLLPAGLLIVVAGFGGALNLIHAGMLAILGVAVLGVWRSAKETPTSIGDVIAAAEHANVATGETIPYEPPVRRQVNWRIVQWVLSVGLAVTAGWAVMIGTLQVDATSSYLRASILVVGAICPLLVLPLMAAGTDLAQRNRSGEACSACVALALLNLFGLIPLLIVGWAIRSVALNGLSTPGYASPRALVQPLSDWFMRVPALPLPLSTWRIDAVVLTIMGFALLPAALGKWRLGRIEAMAMIAGYAAYLAVSAMLSLPR